MYVLLFVFHGHIRLKKIFTNREVLNFLEGTNIYCKVDGNYINFAAACFEKQ